MKRYRRRARPMYRRRRYLAARRGLRRRKSRGQGIVKKAFKVTIPIYPRMYEAEGSTGDPLHGDAAVCFTKAPYYEDGEMSAPMMFANYPGDPADVLSPYMDAQNRLIADMKSIASQYSFWRPGGVKLTWKPTGTPQGICYIRNCNEYSINNGGLTGLYHLNNTWEGVYGATLGENVSSCDKIPVAQPWFKYFKRRIPRKHVKRHGGWLPTPTNSYLASTIGQELSLHCGAGAIYMQVNDQYYHSVSSTNRANMNLMSKFIPLGLMEFSFYIHFKKKDNQYTTVSPIIPMPTGEKLVELNRDKFIKVEPLVLPTT